MELNEYKLKREQTLTLLKDTGVLCDSFDLATQSKQIQADYTGLENETFNLVVVGEFSRGKSTFVNAMLGRKLLPTSSKPTTAVISKIVYGEKRTFNVFYNSGKQKEITEEEFLEIKAQSEGDFVSLDKLKSLIKVKEDLNEISYVKIGYPLDFCRNKVEIVDTPGVNDLNTDRVDITYNYLKKADAVILVLSSTQLLTQTELDFLREQICGNQIKDILVVINGKDKSKSHNETEKSLTERLLKHFNDGIKDVIPQKLPVHLLSSKQALTIRRKNNGDKINPKLLIGLPKDINDTGLPDFEKALGDFLDHEKGAAKIQKYTARIEKYLDNLDEHIKAQHAAAGHSADELKKQLYVLKPKLQKAKSDSRRILQHTVSRLRAKRETIVTEASTAFQNMKQAALLAVDNYNEEMDDKEVEHMINIAIAPLQKKLIATVSDLTNGIFDNEAEKTFEELSKIWQDVDMPNIFAEDVSINYDIDKLAMERESDGDWKLAGLAVAGIVGFAICTSVLSWVGLMLLTGKALSFIDDSMEDKKNQIKKEVRKNFDKNNSRFIEDIREQYEEQCQNFSKQIENIVDSRLENMEDQLTSIINMKEQNEGDARRIQAELKQKSEELQSLRQKLREVSM